MKLINIRQLGEKLGIDRSTIYRWIQQKKLPPSLSSRPALWNESAVAASIRIHKLRVVAREQYV